MVMLISLDQSDVKKYKSGNVKKLLSEIWDLPVTEQKERLEKEIT